MTKKFSIKLNQDPQEVFLKFKTAAAKNGVGLEGDRRLGHFSGKGIEGSYDISGDVLNITLEKKPMLLSWSTLEAKVRDFLA
jgi:hypothetical protein